MNQPKKTRDVAFSVECAAEKSNLIYKGLQVSIKIRSEDSTSFPWLRTFQKGIASSCKIYRNRKFNVRKPLLFSVYFGCFRKIKIDIMCSAFYSDISGNV